MNRKEKPAENSFYSKKVKTIFFSPFSFFSLSLKFNWSEKNWGGKKKKSSSKHKKIVLHICDISRRTVHENKFWHDKRLRRHFSYPVGLFATTSVCVGSYSGQASISKFLSLYKKGKEKRRGKKIYCLNQKIKIYQSRTRKNYLFFINKFYIYS